MKFSKITLGLLVLLLTLQPAMAFLEANKYRMGRELKESGLNIRTAAEARAQAGRLLAIQDDEELLKQVQLLSYLFIMENKLDLGEELVDELMQQGTPRAELTAGTVLLSLIANVPKSNYGLDKKIRNFPDSICDRAAALMMHSSPVMQALGEWTVSMRVKSQDSSTLALKDTFAVQGSDQAWYQSWKQRDPQLMLRDDYARQLIQTHDYLSLEGLNRAVAEVELRISRMAESSQPGTPAAREKLTASLKHTRQLSAAGDLYAAQTAYLSLRKALRDWLQEARPEYPRQGLVYFTNNRITGGVWNVNVPVTNRTNPPLGGLYLTRSTEPSADIQALLEGKAGDGSIRGIDLHWDADRILFSFWNQSITGEEPFGWNPEQYAGIYELTLSDGRVKQLTHSPGYNDIEPCYLPDGGIVFASDRSSYGNQCAGPILQNKRCTTLFRLGAGQKEPVAISNNKDFDRHPHVLNDGTIAFLHWEYQERGLYHTHSVWRSRPDGTNMDAYYKQHISAPMSIRDVRQVPDSDLHVATAQGHHDAQNGPLILINPALGINNEQAMWLVTPGASPVEGGLGPLENQVVPEGGIRNRGGSYINPYPLSEEAFLVGHDLHGNESEFAIYYVDVWGNRELLRRDKDLSCFMPIPFRKRVKPPVVADTVRPEAEYATAFVRNVYQGVEGLAPGTIKYLRLSQSLMLPAPVDHEDTEKPYNHLHYLPGDATAHHFGHWAWSPSRTIGLVKVAADGSAYFKVPAGTPVYLQALDGNFCEVRRMRTSFTLQRGEFRSCTGCHETRLETAGNLDPLPKDTLTAGPQTPEPMPWGDRNPLDYREHIQPIFEQNCVSCHGQENPAAGIELTNRKIGGFMQSYRSLFGLKPEDPTPINSLDWHLVLNPDAKDDKYITNKDAVKIHKRMQKNDWPGQLVSISDRMDDASITIPYQFGSNQSLLIQTLLNPSDAHKGLRAQMGEQDWLKLVTWIDYNGIYYSNLFDVRDYQKTKTFTAVPYDLPSPWLPGDRNPTFFNKAVNDDLPRIEPGVTSR